MIDFLDELGNFKQKKFYTSICNLFYILQQWTHSQYFLGTNIRNIIMEIF